MRQRTLRCSPTSSTSCTAHPRRPQSSPHCRRRRSSARASSGCCDISRRTCRGPRSQASYPSRRTPSARTCAASTPSSRSVTGPRPCSAPGNCCCWRPAASASPGGHRIPVIRGHLPARDHGVMDPAPAPYLIRIRGHLGATVLCAFPALAPQHHGAYTVLTGLLDQSALYGVLAEIEALGLDLLEIRKLTLDRTSPEPGDGRSP